MIHLHNSSNSFSFKEKRLCYGIDIYMEWKDMTEAEKEARITGFRTDAGNTGYLREAYHGGPYATKVLVKEAFDSKEGEARIPAKVMRDRLPIVISLAKERERVVYKHDIPEEYVLNSFYDFVALAEKMEKKTGEPVLIIASY